MATLLNEDLSRILNWSERNLLPVNASKTKVMLITRNRDTHSYPHIILGNDPTQFVNKVSVLGFVIQNNLEWESHINTQCSKIYSGLRLLKLTSYKLPIPIKLKLFKSLLLPHFMYGDVFLLNASVMALDRLRVALNCCVRFVFNLTRYSRVTHLQQQLIGCRFYDFFKFRNCIQLLKIQNSPRYLFEKLQPFQSNRNRNFLLPRFNTAHYRSTLFVQGIVFWNQIPNDIKHNYNLSGFRRDCVTWLNSENQQQR